MADATALACFDGSPDAAAALRAGAALAPDLRADVLHVWRPPVPTADLLQERDVGSLDELAALLAEEGAARAREIAEEGAAVARAAGWRAEPLVERSHGGVWYEVVRVAAERDAAVVVVGARGVGGARAALGSVSDAVVGVARRPVLVVPAPGGDDERPSGPLLLAHDGSELSAFAIERAGALLGERPALVVTVADGDDDADAVAAEGVERARAAGLDASARVERVEASLRHRPDWGPWHALVAIARDEDAAAIVVGARGQSALRRLVLGSVSRGVLHHAAQPVLVVPDPEDAR